MWDLQMKTNQLTEGIDILVHGQQHLYAYEDENEAEAILEVFEILG